LRHQGYSYFVSTCFVVLCVIRARRGKTAPEKPVIIPAGPHGGKRFVLAVQM